MKTYTLEEVTNELIGKIGTQNRAKFEADLKLELLNLNDSIAKNNE
ncbi:hypothetical protein ACHRVZ_03685 [Flavobacterium sp. FlaQc-57]